MTNHSENAQNYSRRNAFAAAVESLVKSHTKPEQVNAPGKTFQVSRVETTVYMYGFYLNCDGLDRRAEDNIVGEVRALFPRLRIVVSRKSTKHARFITFSF